MLSDKEYRVAQVQATKTHHRAAGSLFRARNRLRESLTAIKAVKVSLRRCRKESTKAKAEKKLRLLQIRITKALRKCRRCRSDLIVARLIIEPRLAWKQTPGGELSCVLMPSDFNRKKVNILEKGGL